MFKYFESPSFQRSTNPKFIKFIFSPYSPLIPKRMYKISGEMPKFAAAGATTFSGENLGFYRRRKARRKGNTGMPWDTDTK